MAYPQDYAGSARRHLQAAQTLAESVASGARAGSIAVSGYLFGLAGELALKHMMRESGIMPLTPNQRAADPFYAHFPHIKTRLLDTISGRRAGQLRQLAGDSKLFQYWDTDMRYAPISDIQEAWVVAWRTNAESMIQVMDIP